jgi:hypothetical protein
MGNDDIPKDLPKCELIRVLAEKVSQREDIGFNVLGRLDEFRQRVSGEARQINVLFPEYTPHDEHYHLRRLFNVADTVLGKELISAMNAGELFVLAVALYGHDWGMAVNEIEKNYIINDLNSDDKVPSELWILPDEKNRFRLFARDQQLLNEDNKLEDISVEKWREYVRQTHAFRSGARIGKFFEPIDGGVSDAAARVCIGHWLDFEDLQDHDSYPINYSVMGDQVNLRALAVYLRLIDLLDLAEYRTPYVIWKFVAPRDSRSKMAWDKHRALRAVTCPKYQEGRIIRVDGSTDSHEVYAALEDLRIWCEAQFRGCNDILARMNDPCHKLDIYHIEWHVEARGFKKTSIGFQFNRESMFEILGNEIYQGDPYVFLRELLQNSIDAIRMRCEVLRKYAKIEPANLGVIKVDVKHLDNNDVIITWSDDGIGMDEYIIQNYLAVAGKSYYRSQDFEKMGLKMDPISRFGIGILSCFVAADSIELETYKDPNLHPRSEPLKIVIPDKSKQFRIEVLSEGSVEIGTTIKVFVSGKKISKDNNSEMDNLNVTEYLEIIAGFVEFPIIINEDSKRTIILHPKKNIEDAKQRFGKEYNFHKLDLKYPWHEAILPQDMQIAQEVLIEKSFDLASELGLEDHEGILSSLIPSDEVKDLESLGDEITIKRTNRKQTESIRLSDDWKYRGSEQGLSRSSMYNRSCMVYRNGIFIPIESRPSKSWIRDSMPKSYLVANLSKERAPLVDLSRTNFCKRDIHWYDPIHEVYIKKILDLNLEGLLALNPFDRLFQMGRILVSYNITANDLWKEFPNDYWPLVFLNPKGKINVQEYRHISKNVLFKFPIPLNRDELTKLLKSETYGGFLINWIGNDIIIEEDRSPYFRSGYLSGAIEISNQPIIQSYHDAYARFISPPWQDNPPLVQCVLEQIKDSQKTQKNTAKKLFEKVFEDIKGLDSHDLSLLNDYIGTNSGYKYNIKFINFLKPFEHLFSYGSKIINIGNPSGEDLLKFICFILHKKNFADLHQDLIGRLDDKIYEFFNTNAGKYDYESLERGTLIEDWTNVDSMLIDIWRAAKEANISSIVDIEDAIPVYDDFVPGTIIRSKKDRMKFNKIGDFGEPI